MRVVKMIVPLALIAVIVFGCKKNATVSSCPSPLFDCSAVTCSSIPVTNFQFRLIDKITGADLIFGTNPRYTINDVALYRDFSQALPLPLAVDNANKKLVCNSGRNDMYLIIKNKTYTLTAVYNANSCCSSIVRELVMDGKQICTCCDDIITLAVQ